ncbi:hypothetical protein B0H13DRAFT_1933795 [Mycena leptocephala]|nr:hypothetical protein B0H13DRAFT_1933795 [Mycena leptocephala]
MARLFKHKMHGVTPRNIKVVSCSDHPSIPVSAASESSREDGEVNACGGWYPKMDGESRGRGGKRMRFVDGTPTRVIRILVLVALPSPPAPECRRRRAAKREQGGVRASASGELASLMMAIGTTSQRVTWRWCIDKRAMCVSHMPDSSVASAPRRRRVELPEEIHRAMFRRGSPHTIRWPSPSKSRQDEEKKNIEGFPLSYESIVHTCAIARGRAGRIKVGAISLHTLVGSRAYAIVSIAVAFGRLYTKGGTYMQSNPRHIQPTGGTLNKCAARERKSGTFHFGNVPGLAPTIMGKDTCHFCSFPPPTTTLRSNLPANTSKARQNAQLWHQQLEAYRHRSTLIDRVSARQLIDFHTYVRRAMARRITT